MNASKPKVSDIRVSQETESASSITQMTLNKHIRLIIACLPFFLLLFLLLLLLLFATRKLSLRIVFVVFLCAIFKYLLPSQK